MGSASVELRAHPLRVCGFRVGGVSGARRLSLIDPAARRPRDRKWKRWEPGAPMELWQMDVVGGFALAAAGG